MAEQPKAYVSKGARSSVVKIAGQGHLAEEFIQPPKNFKDALARAVIRDDAHNAAMNIYYSHLAMFDMETEKEDEINLLTGTCSIGGLNRSAAIMDDTQIYTPAGLGIKDSKEHEKAIKELREERNRSGENRNRN